MKRHTITIAMILAVLMIASTAMAQIYHTPPGQRGGREPLDIEVWTNKEEGGSFGQGENLVIYFRTNHDAFVTIYDLDTKGNINLLYPYDYRDENFVEGGVVYTIPDYYDDYVLRVNGPPGLEFVQAIASDRDFMIPDWSYNFRDPEGWREIDSDREALAYLEFINHKYFPVENCVMTCDMDYSFFEVRKNWQYSWDSYYYDDYSYYDDDVHVVHHYHPYYYRPIYYDPWWDPWDWCGTMYVGYPHGGAIWINGVFYGYAPLFIPRLSIGWWDVRVVYGGSVYYHDKVKIRRGLSHELYQAGGSKYKWKTSTRASAKYNTTAQKYYPKTKSLSYKSSAKYTAGGKSGKTSYTKGSSSGKYNRDGKATYKSGSSKQSKGSRQSYGKTSYKGTSGKTGTKGGSKYGKSYKGSSKSTQGKSGYKKGTASSGKTKSSKGTTRSKTGTYNKGSKSSKSGGGSKTDKNRKSYEPSARFQKKGDRTSYGTSDYGSRSKSGSSYGKSSKSYSGGKSGSSYKRGTSSRSGSSYGRSSSNRSGKSSSGYKSSGSSSRSKGSTYRGTSSSRSSGSKSSGSYKGSSGSSSKSSGSTRSKSSGSSGSKSRGSGSKRGK